MSKTKSLVLQCVGVFVMFLGVWWWVGREYEKTHPVQEWKTVEIPEPVKIYQGRWSKGYLEVIGK